MKDSDFDVAVFDSLPKRIQVSWKQEKQRLSSWLKSLPKPIGLMACNDERSQQVVEVCKTCGILIPDEIAIIGVDNDEMICELSSPPLSSIALNEELAGFQAAELLDSLMAGEKMEGQNIIVKPLKIVTRQSTDILAIENSEVRKALSFINKNARRPIQVNDAVEATTTSRRSLERLFREFLNCTIHEKIYQRRVEHIVRLLIETNNSVLHIARSLGFPGVTQLDRYFKKAKGITPLAYRKKYKHKGHL